MDILFFIGLIILSGFVFGKVVNYFKFPAVIGYLLAGLILGNSFFNLFSLELLEKLGIFNDLALGIIAFIIGSEMRLSTLKRMGPKVVNIILGEALGAFFLVALAVYFLTHKLYLALIFGAMAPASAPAGTAIVLQEYKAKGPLTNFIYAVVGLDDALAIMIYVLAAAFSKFLITGEQISALSLIKGPFLEITGAILVGGMVGSISAYFIRKLKKIDILPVSLATILICTGLAKCFHLSLILTNLSLGMLFANLFLLANRRAYEAIQLIAPPIYIIFFVIAGAHLQIKLLPAMGMLGVIYILARSTGKLGGIYLSTLLSKTEPVIKKYLGFGILSQAGVAIGLAILATREFSHLGPAGENLACLVINTIAATTIIFEIIGPVGVKFAIGRAGEIGKSKR